jgi:four helix bundle protein
MQDYHELQIWQRSMQYAVDLYRFSALLPDEERYHLVVQLRKAATGVNDSIQQVNVSRLPCSSMREIRSHV